MKTNQVLALAIAHLTCASGYATQSLPPLPNGDLPKPTISYWANMGQELDTNGDPASNALFVSEGTQPKVYLQSHAKASLTYATSSQPGGPVDQVARFDIETVGELAAQSNPVGALLRNYRKHYWTGSTPVMNVPGFSGVIYEDVYPGVDWHWFSGAGGMKMAFVCEPGSTPETIQLQFSGQDSMKLDVEGTLKTYQQGRWIHYRQATAYQYDSQNHITYLDWNASWSVSEGSSIASFIVGEFDPDLPIVLLIEEAPLPSAAPNNNIPYSTYLGGGLKDVVNEIALAPDGSYYAAGMVEDHGFPPTVGLVFVNEPLQKGFITRFNSNYERDWTGYYAGEIRSIAYDGGNQRLVVGGLPGSSLGVVLFNGGYTSTTGGGCLGAINITEPLNPVLIWSTRWPSQVVTKVGVTSTGRIYAVGSVIGGTTFPSLSPGGEPTQYYQPNAGSSGYADGFIASFDADSHLVFATHLGGEKEDLILDMAIDEVGDRFGVVGSTRSTAHQGAYNCQVTPGVFPECTYGFAYEEFNCNANNNCTNYPDGFFAVFSLNMDNVHISRFGGLNSQIVTGIAFNSSHDMYLVGLSGTGQGQATYGPTNCQPPSPTNLGCLAHCPSPGAFDRAGSDALLGNHFLAKFTPGFNLVWSTAIGGQGYEIATEGIYGVNGRPMNGPQVAIDNNDDVYIAGSSASGGVDFPSPKPIDMIENSQYYYEPTNSNFYDLPGILNEHPDVYVGKFSGETGAVLMGTFYGGRGGLPTVSTDNGDMLTSLAVGNSRVFISGATTSNVEFPLSTLDGTISSYIDLTPPNNLLPGAPDVTQGYIAQLSWVFTSIDDMSGTSEQPNLLAWFNEDGQSITLKLPVAFERSTIGIELFDSAGKLLFSRVVNTTSNALELPTGELPSGLYVGHLRGTPYTFKAILTNTH